jgi:hypothetical protein
MQSSGLLRLQTRRSERGDALKAPAARVQRRLINMMFMPAHG